MPWRKGNRLHVVTESEAAGAVAEIFDEVKAVLGISYVPLSFQAFACYPKFLQEQWAVFKPLLGTREFFELASRLRAEAYTFLHNYFNIAPLGEGWAASEAVPTVELFCYLEPALLLMLSAQLQAFDGPVGTGATPHPADRITFGASPQFIDPESAPAGVRRVLEEIRHTLELSYSGDEVRALAEWPELLFAYWRSLKPSVQSLFHEQAIFRMRESAWSCAQEIPAKADLDYSRLMESGVDPDDVAVITRLTELLVRGTTIGVLNATFAKIGLEGGNREENTPLGEERVA